jgi:FkbM family methyltransferase
VVGKSLKPLLRRAFAAAGYAVRDVGRGVGGVELLHDARILLGGVKEPMLFDVGANVGQTSLAMLSAFQTAQIRAFEPSPSTFETLCRAVRDRPGVTVEALAMGEAEGVLPFHVTRDHSVNDSILAPTSNAGGKIVDVRVETIDTYCHKHGIDSISLLKIDAQGYDLHVLKGARRMLDARRIKLYSCEAIFEKMYEGQATLRDLLAFADQVGYVLVGFYEQTYVKDRLSYLDALFYTG